MNAIGSILASSYPSAFAAQSLGASSAKSWQTGNVNAMNDENIGNGPSMDTESETTSGAAIAAVANASDQRYLLNAIRDEASQRRKNRNRPYGQKLAPKSMLINVLG